MRPQNWSAPGLSVRSRVLVGLLASTWRPLSAQVPVGPAGVEAARLLFERVLAHASPPLPQTAYVPVEDRDAAGRVVRGEWVRARWSRPDRGVILYLHGSGYAICSSRTHRGLTSQLSSRTGIPVFSLDYRLAPEHRHPAALEDARAAWDWLRAQGYAAEQIAVAGDSAGGHLSLLLGLDLARTGQPLPASLVTLSPLIDMELAGARVRDRMSRDPFTHPRLARRVLKLYADDAQRADLNRRLFFDDVAAFPPTLIHNGSAEMLSADCTELARRMRRAGLEVQHRVWPGQMHVFQALTAVVPESHRALAEVAEFIGQGLSARRWPMDLPSGEVQSA